MICNRSEWLWWLAGVAAWWLAGMAEWWLAGVGRLGLWWADAGESRVVELNQTININ